MLAERHLNRLIAGALLLVPLIAWSLDEPFIITLVTRATILALAGVGLNLALGLGGMVSLGHATFFGLGGYAMGVLASHAQDDTSLYEGAITIQGSSSMPLIWLVAMLLGGFAALCVGLLSLRTTGVYFIMVTLAFGQMAYYFAISWPAYGGEDGLSIYVRNAFPGLDTLDPLQFFAICYAVLILVLWLVGRLSNAPFGLALGAVRQNAQRVQSVGISPFRIRLLAFTVSGAITALAGALFADLNRFVSPAMFSWQTSGELIVFVLLGGVARLYGPVAGAAIFIALEHLLGGVSDYWAIGLGVILLLIVLFARGGLIGALARQETTHD